MNYDEFAFFNQQLAGMLKSGIPLEGALHQLCASMRQGTLRTELERLQADLAQGTPLERALAARDLPEFYRAMLRVGVQSGDLPGVLTLLADHYERSHSVGARLKGLAVYPVIVLVSALALSVALSFILTGLIREINVGNDMAGMSLERLLVTTWMTPVLLAVMAAAVTAAFLYKPLQRRLRWRLPGFREANLAHVAGSLSLLLQRGTDLKAALALVRECEGDSPAGRELAQWQERLSQGHGRLPDFGSQGRVFPPLFLWLAGSVGDDLAAGFGRAAEIYHGRALYRIEMMLYAFLPVSVLLLGMMIVGQVAPLIFVLRGWMQFVGDVGG